MIRRVVHKFGGSCLRSAEDLERIEARVRTEPIEPLVVVSALWGVTDRLVRAQATVDMRTASFVT